MPAPDGHDRLLPDDWAEHVRTMDPDDLRLLATSLPLIEQAKGILMGHYGCDATTAFTILRRWSAARQTKVRDLSQALVEEASREPGTDGEHAGTVERFVRAHGLG